MSALDVTTRTRRVVLGERTEMSGLRGSGGRRWGVAVGVAVVLRSGLLATVVLSLLLSSASRPVGARPLFHTEEDNKNMNAMMYLMRYGYMDDLNMGGQMSASLLSPDVFETRIMEFQRFAGLEETGVADAKTLEMMQKPRCGVKDIVGHGSRAKRRRKRYALQGSRWRVKNLTYKVSSYPTTRRLNKRDVDKEVERALDVWSRHTDLTFTRKTSGKVHIEIKFEKREHGDGDPFDGQGGTLAHAFFPLFGGDAHFDDEEVWTKGTFVGTNFLQTAAHEFGHSLGLSHSDVNSALMAPFYRGFEEEVRLGKDDVSAIQELYGEKKKRRPPTENTISNTGGVSTPSSSDNDNDDDDDDDNDDDSGDDEELCNDASIDAIVTVKDGTTYTFKGSQYWRLTDDSIAPGYPRSISRDWDGLPANVDAAFTWTNGKTYVFKGSRYWRFTNTDLDRGYPKSISSGFDGIPNNVDAAFVWTGNEKIYFFKDDKYYKFDPEKKPPVPRSYPKPVSNWEGIPNSVDDALRYSNGYTYFFKDGKYWRFDDTSFKVDRADPEFPRPAGFWWFGCSSIDQGTVSTTTTRRPTTTTTTTTTARRDGGGKGWVFTWNKNRNQWDLSADDDDDNVVGNEVFNDAGKGRRGRGSSSGSGSGSGEEGGNSEKTTLWRKIKGVFKDVFSFAKGVG